MPTPALKSLASKSGKSLDDLERYWSDAKKDAADNGHAEDWAYIMGIVKRRAGLSEGRADALMEQSEELMAIQKSLQTKAHVFADATVIASDVVCIYGYGDAQEMSRAENFLQGELGYTVLRAFLDPPDYDATWEINIRF